MGVLDVLLVVIGEVNDIGIELCFWLSGEMFIDLNFYYDILVKCLCEFFFLNLGVSIIFIDECEEIKIDYFKYEGGI